MQREIKFRFCRPSTNKMIYPTMRNFNDLIESEDWKVMQFTGLHDIDGNEIYEGDVLQILDEKVKVIYNSFKACFDIEYIGGDCERMCETWDEGGEKYEVIGNIYENPELIA